MLRILSKLIQIASLTLTLGEFSFVGNVLATTVHQKWMANINNNGIIEMDLGLVRAIILQKLEGSGEFQGGKTEKKIFPFQKPHGVFFGRIWYLKNSFFILEPRKIVPHRNQWRLRP